MLREQPCPITVFLLYQLRLQEVIVNYGVILLTKTLNAKSCYS
jgi:hypothetical protein